MRCQREIICNSYTTGERRQTGCLFNDDILEMQRGFCDYKKKMRTGNAAELELVPNPSTMA